MSIFLHRLCKIVFVGGDRMKKKVLIMAGYYLPSVKGGGPIQSIRNLVDNFGDEIDIYIIALDRDLGDEIPFQNIILNEWTKVENASVYYSDHNLLNWRKLITIIKGLGCEVLYLNSFFAFKYSIIPILLYKLYIISCPKIILAPRGQFSSGALGIRSWKKKAYIEVAKLLNMYKGIEWHATSEIEKSDIERLFGREIKVHTANNLTGNYSFLKYEKSLIKYVGKLKLAYIARIHPMKNLLQTLEILKKIKGNVEFNIYGPIEDESYWNKCQNAIKNMHENIKVNYLGLIANENVNDVYKEHHVAILMTLGENFGHSIAEALIGGCPVIISDRTPWKNLKEFNAGYDISLENEGEYISVISQYIEMDNMNYQNTSKSAFNFAKTNSNSNEIINSYFRMLDIREK